MGKLLGTYYMPHPPIVIPAVGGKDHHLCQTTYGAMVHMGKAIAEHAPKRIVLISPHGTVFSDGMGILYNHHLTGDLSQFGHPDLALKKKNDLAFVDSLVQAAFKSDIILAKIDPVFADDMDIPWELDHGALVPLWFVDQYKLDYDLVHLTYGLLSPSKLYEFGSLLRRVVKEALGDTVVILSGDMSHALKDAGPYAYHPSGQVFDNTVVEAFKQGDYKSILTLGNQLREEAKECGFRSMCIGFGLHDRMLTTPQVHSYEGPFGVGYMVASIEESDGIVPSLLPDLIKDYQDKQAKRLSLEDDYIKLARHVINTFVLMGEKPEVDRQMYNIEAEERACFVSIKTEAGLRGCIGTIYPTRSKLLDEIVDNAVKACSEDPRFDPVSEDELAELEISVDVLMEPQPVTDVAELDPQKYGLVVRAGIKKGVLLPMLEGIDTVEDQIRIAKSKGSIGDEPYDLFRFEVIRHEAKL